ncbi:MAG: hypothetical protein AB7P23_10675, partial [Amphiplicatus sp.]
FRSGTGVWRRGLTAAAAFYLALVQILTAAHAASGEGMAPDHDKAACVFHLAIDRAHAPPPASQALVILPSTAYARLAARLDIVLVGESADIPPPRGPPSV